MQFDPNEKILIATAEGSSMNIKMHSNMVSFKQFADACSKPKQGGKHEGYFTRGVPDVQEEYTSKTGKDYFNGRFRNDDAIPKADFLIIDADNSEASPSEVHSQLKHEMIAHFIYTSHSHSADKNNFRVVIPCEISSKKYLVATILQLMEKIDGVKYVREMGVWSQAWYLPTRDDISDGIFESFQYMDGTAYVEVREEQTNNRNQDSTGNLIAEEAQDMDGMINTIITGADGMHHAMKSYSYGQIQDGVAPAVVIATLKGLMQACANKDGRWQSRFDDIERLVEGAVSPAEDVVIPDMEKTKLVKAMSFPPGLAGSMCKSVYDYSPYPNNMVSIVTVLGLLAGVAGRRFNVSETGLNLYLTLLMGTGEGKSVIDSFIQRMLVAGNTVKGSDAPLSNESKTFVGDRRYTGAKSLMRRLKEKRCFVSVFTEAGFMFASKTGDKAGLTRTILDLIGKSGHMECMAAESYSDDKNSIEEVQSPCFSMVNESTPDVFLQSLKDGTQTGEITRMHVFRVVSDSHKFNRNKKFKIDPDVQIKFHKLVARCLKTQTDNNPDASHFDLQEKHMDFIDKCGAELVECREDNPIKSAMLSRAALKTIKVACLLTLFNHHFAGGMREGLQIADECWDWAKELHEYEMEGLEEFFKVSGNDDLYDISVGSVYKTITKIFNHGYADKKQQVSTRDVKEARIPLSILRYSLRKNKSVSDLSAFSKPGFDILLDYMEKNKWAKQINVERIKYVQFSSGYFIEGKYGE